MKYWNKARVRRAQERRERREEHAHTAHLQEEVRKRTYTKGDARKNARLMLEVLGGAIHRRMLARLRKGGAMSITHLSEPFRIMLPDAMRHVRILERSGLITTEKRGRIRFCIYNPSAAKELAVWLASRDPFALD